MKCRRCGGSGEVFLREIGIVAGCSECDGTGEVKLFKNERMAINLCIDVTVGDGRDSWRVFAPDTPYGPVYGKGGTLSQALANFDYQYVMAKEKQA